MPLGVEWRVPYRVDLPTTGAMSVSDAFERLVELGALDLEENAAGGLAALMPDRVTSRQVARTLGLARVTTTAAVGRDDGSVWVLSPRPIQAGPLRIVPAGAGSPDRPERRTPLTLRLADSAAFGTGLHPTTALCLELIADTVAVACPDSMLDIGTGSGILALGALVLGIPRATAIDVEPPALAATAHNARLNDLSDRLDLRLGGPDALTGTWPLVVANVLAAPLIEMASTLVRRVGRRGQLILSGVPVSASEEVARAYVRLGMAQVGHRERGGWVALDLRAGW